MCQIAAVLQEADTEQVVLENVTEIEVLGDGVKLLTMFDEPLEMEGVGIARIDFLGGRVYLVPKAAR